MRSGLWDAQRGADHRAAAHGVHQREWVQGRRSESHRAKPKVVADTIEVERDSEHYHKDNARRNGRALEVLHLARVRVGERFRGDIETRQPTNAANDEVR